jgi:nucleotide-binding universal stress UspA family protein
MKPVFEHITVPVDGSSTSERGVAFALELAGDGGLVSFCSVVDPMLACEPAAYGVAIDPGPMIEVLDEDADVFCTRARQTATDHHVAADTAVLHGMSISEIEDFVKRNGSDAIVIGTHGRSGIARALLGSVAEGILRRVSIPVVAVHENDQMRTGPIAVAYDRSPAARAALQLAVEMAAARGMSLLLIHVREKNEPPDGDGLVEDAAAYCREHGVAVRMAIQQGPAADTILSAVEREDCCMIVAGTHGRGPLAQAVLGSVAMAVVERAHVPVITVRNAA